MSEAPSSCDHSVSEDCCVYLYVSTAENEHGECLAVFVTPVFPEHGTVPSTKGRFRKHSLNNGMND